MKRTFAYRGGKLTEISREPGEIRHSDGKRIIQEGTMAERVLFGFQQEEQRHGSAMFQKFPFSANHIRKVWAQ